MNNFFTFLKETSQNIKSNPLVEKSRKELEKMGCSLSGLKNLYDSFNGNEEVYIGERRFRIVQQIGEGGYAYVYLVMEVLRDYTEDLKSKTPFLLLWK